MQKIIRAKYSFSGKNIVKALKIAFPGYHFPPPLGSLETGDFPFNELFISHGSPRLTVNRGQVSKVEQWVSPLSCLECRSRSQDDQNERVCEGQPEHNRVPAQHIDGQVVGVVRVNDFLILPPNHPESSGLAAPSCHRITRL